MAKRSLLWLWLQAKHEEIGIAWDAYLTHTRLILWQSLGYVKHTQSVGVFSAMCSHSCSFMQSLATAALMTLVATMIALDEAAQPMDQNRS